MLAVLTTTVNGAESGGYRGRRRHQHRHNHDKGPSHEPWPLSVHLNAEQAHDRPVPLRRPVRGEGAGRPLSGRAADIVMMPPDRAGHRQTTSFASSKGCCAGHDKGLRELAAVCR